MTLIEQLARVHTLYVGTLILVPAMLSFCGKHHEYTATTRAGRFLSHIGAYTATYIYVFHVMIGNVVSVIVPRMLAVDSLKAAYKWLNPILVCIASIVCGEIVFILKRVLFKKR